MPEVTLNYLESLIHVNDPSFYLGDKEHNQSDVDGEHNGERGESKRSVLLRGQDHGDRSCNHAQNLKERDVHKEGKKRGESKVNQ